ncbi:MAG: M3 family metallopeptidase [Gammaproteobacteria bacterium]|nr:M3 family metallopeptidase [Gammaproteobacteria bacterium]
MSHPKPDTFTLPRFNEIQAEQTVPALQELIAQHRRKLAALLEDGAARDFDALVPALEEMNHELSRAWSPVSHLHGVLGSPEWREAYNECLPKLTEHSTEISQNVRLYEAFLNISEHLPADSPDAARALVHQALRDFRLAGVSLEDDLKKTFSDTRRQLAQVQSKFDQNVRDATDAWHHTATSQDEVSGLSPATLERAAALAREHGCDGWRLTLDFPTYHDVMIHADDRNLRERFYRAWATRASDVGDTPQYDNSEYIEKILELRHRAATLIGYENFAEYSLATKMAVSTAEVIEFLQELAEKTRDAAQREFDAIQKIAPFPMQAWDYGYFQEKLKQEKYSISDDELRQYFPVRKVLDGLFELAGKLYGVSVNLIQEVQSWHDSVLFYEVRDETGEAIGGFYADLYARPGKRNGAWIDECVVRKSLNGETVLPVGYLVCNFIPPDANGQSLLTHQDVVTLFHEFGHMLHHLLTRIDYPSIAGINGVPWDAVELPSQFMENFAWCEDVLTRASGHHETGEPLPESMFRRLTESRKFGAGLAMLRQIEFALFDFRTHAEYDPAHGGRVLEILDEVRRDVAVTDHPSYNRLPHSFGHVFAGGYAAGYYSYKWAEVLAADAFSAFEESGIFDQQTATRFRSSILEIGGSRDIMDAYVDFRGRKPTLEALLRQSGIWKAA